MGAFKDRSGERFGRLTIINHSGWLFNNQKIRRSEWLCKCDCGTTLKVDSLLLRRGKNSKKSCGCLYNETRGRFKHGKVGTPVYNSYLTMIQRCTNPTNTGYSDYGAVGITVCERWLDSFENFLEDMGERPEGTSLDRIENHLGYFKENCRWSTNSVQGFNKKILKSNKTGCAGVWLDSKHNTYRVKLTKDKRQLNLGSFKDFKAAVKCRYEAELRYYGFTVIPFDFLFELGLV